MSPERAETGGIKRGVPWLAPNEGSGSLWLSGCFCHWGGLVSNVILQGGEEAEMGREEFCLNFSCLALKYKFLFHQECFVSFLQESVILEDTAFLLAWWTF